MYTDTDAHTPTLEKKREVANIQEDIPTTTFP